MDGKHICLSVERVEAIFWEVLAPSRCIEIGMPGMVDDAHRKCMTELGKSETNAPQPKYSERLLRHIMSRFKATFPITSADALFRSRILPESRNY